MSAPKTEPGFHGHAQRHEVPPPLGKAVRAGRFGRMFPELSTPLEVPDAALVALGMAMRDDAAPAGVPSGDNENIPAGYTYLGQFIDHDITLDTTTLTEIVDDPMAVENFRTPRLDLDSVYGFGPRAQPSLYDRTTKGMGGDPAPVKLLLGKTFIGGAEAAFADLPHDLPRNAQGFAIIGDERNDENLLVAQTHVAFLRFHNAMADRLAGKVPSGRLFDSTRRAVVDLYQAMVLRDFLTKLCDVNDIALAVKQREFFRFEDFGAFGQPYMPIEFSVAAYRLGHSMVREVYSHNRIFTPGGVVAANFDLLFQFTAKSGQIGTTGEGLAAKPTLPGDWIIDWRRFLAFEAPQPPGSVRLNLSRNIDPYLAKELHELGLPPNTSGPTPDGSSSLAVMNLRRGVKMKLPAAQEVARFMGIPVLSPDEIGDDTPDGKAARAHGLHLRTPLWYYILKEAAKKQGGARLGPLGSRIVAETFVGLLDGDPTSILGRAPSWQFGDPIPGLALEGADRRFTFSDMLMIAAEHRENGAVTVNLSPVG